MSALRKAGVWLGLVEEDDERHRDGVFDDDFGDDDDEFDPPARPRSLSRPSSRGTDRETRSAERSERVRADRSPWDARADRSERDARAGRSELDLRPSDRDRSDRDRLDRDRLERDRLERDRLERDRLERDRLERDARPDGGSVRQLARPSPVPSGSVSYPIQDNLALAPQVQLRERAVVSDEGSRRPQITTLHPTTYNEARTIGEHFRDGHPVIMNLTEMAEPDAKRLVDFAAGLAFGLRGSMERVTNRVFLLSPPNIQVSAEDKARIAEGGFFDQV